MDREQHIGQILSFIASEVSEKSLQITMDTPVEAIKMDSIDVIHVIFKAEEEFDVEIDISQQAKFEVVGDFVLELLKFIEKRKVDPAVSVARTDLPATAARRSKAVNLVKLPEVPLAKAVGRLPGAPAPRLANKTAVRVGDSVPAGTGASGASDKTSKTASETASKAPTKRTARKPVIVAVNETTQKSANQPEKMAVQKAVRRAPEKAAQQTGIKRADKAARKPREKSSGKTS